MGPHRTIILTNNTMILKALKLLLFIALSVVEFIFKTLTTIAKTLKEHFEK